MIKMSNKWIAWLAILFLSTIVHAQNQPVINSVIEGKVI